MLEQLLAAIVSLGSSGVQNLLTSAGENVGKKFKESYMWRKLLVETENSLSKMSRKKNSFLMI